MTSTPLPLWAFLLLPVGVVGFFLLVSFVLGTVSGWRRLAKRFPAPQKASGPTIGFRSAVFDFGVGYNHCLTLEANERGLVLRVLPPFSVTHPPILAPWDSLRTEHTRFLWRRMVRVRLESAGTRVGQFSFPLADAEEFAALSSKRFPFPGG